MIYFHTWIFCAEFVTASPFLQIAVFINFCSTTWSFSFLKRWCTTFVFYTTLFERKYAILYGKFSTTIVFILPFRLTYMESSLVDKQIVKSIIPAITITKYSSHLCRYHNNRYILPIYP